MTPRLVWVAVTCVVTCVVLGGCDCGVRTAPAEPAALVASPQRLLMPQTFIGRSSARAVEIWNSGRAPAQVDVALNGAGLSTATTRLELGGGATEVVTVVFSPTQAGAVSGALTVGALVVPVDAEGLAVPTCSASEVCVAASFDFEQAQCVEAPRADGTACETSCVQGACSSSVCVGQLKGCDDGDACTVDACSDVAGCAHAPRVCPAPASPCQQATCDVLTGCATEDVPDGTLCGPDDCLATAVDVCLAGQCVPRTRPDLSRCANRWVPTSITGRSTAPMVYDEARQRLLVFGGSNGTTSPLGDTWDSDGATWRNRLPVASPPARFLTAMVYDSARRRAWCSSAAAGGAHGWPTPGNGTASPGRPGPR